MMGAERRSMIMTDDEKKLTAYHEGGHALVALHTPASDPIHKATIIPRGRALGMVMRLPERDQVSKSYEQLISDLAVAMGGRVAEEIIFGKDKVTTGASSDINMVTQYARKMVTEWGFSDKLGNVKYVDNQEEVFLGHSVAQHKNVSEKTAQLIDEEVRRYSDEAYVFAKRVLTEHLDDLHVLAKGLLEYETLSGKEIDALLRGEEINRAGHSNGGGKDAGGGRRSTVPTTGGARKENPGEGGGDLSPEPQPGS